ncbi:MAG: class IV adenylate cyclase [Acidobacteriota bacterium]|nr:class IV adenylate cyclase [Acidobacteriota bacterium]
MREIEIKIEVDCADRAREKLGRAGATALVPRSFEDNRVYDDEHLSFARGRRLLRLRSTQGRHLLTFKHPPEHSEEGARYKVRVEHQCEVSDAEEMEKILLALGYHQTWRYQKYRQSYELDGVHVEIDELPFATFIELEGPPEGIDSAARKLGYGPADYSTATYRELFCRQVGSDEPGDMLFDGVDAR